MSAEDLTHVCQTIANVTKKLKMRVFIYHAAVLHLGNPGSN